MAVNLALVWLPVALLDQLPAVDLRTITVANALVAVGLAIVAGWRIAWRALLLWLPFAALLFIVHGVLNREFAVGDGPLPLRPAGLRHAWEIAVSLAAPMCAGALFMAAGREGIKNSILRRLLGTSGTFVLLLASAQIDVVVRRIAAVWEAQRARGVELGPGLLVRAAALPALVVPVTMSTLTEAEDRALYLANRNVTHAPFPRYAPVSSGVRVGGLIVAAMPYVPLLAVLWPGK